MMVKAKISKVFMNGGIALRDLYPNDDRDLPGGHTPSSWPRDSKLLRLGFHDCLKYTDGTGGCDGCLNWKGVGFRFNASFVGTNEYPDQFETNNNGLAASMELLQEIYVNPSFPPKTPVLSQSLQESGKSRADLVALGTILAVEHGIEYNNRVCRDRLDPLIFKQCHHKQGEADCEMIMPRPIKFQYGRADCITSHEKPYITTKEETHPSIMTNGEGTMHFFKNNFGMNGREVVALMGAHSLGRMHIDITVLPYVWTSRGTHMLNNHYYSLLAKRDQYHFSGSNCEKVGDPWNRKAKSRWVPHVRQFTKNGGPVHWIHMSYSCPNCESTNENEFNNFVDDASSGRHCCTDKPENTYCRPDNGRTKNDRTEINARVDANGSWPWMINGDDNINAGCEKFKFIVGIDETSLSFEFGLYRDFQVENGAPKGCPGLENFNLAKWAEGPGDQNQYTWGQGHINSPLSNPEWKWPSTGEPLCGKQMLAEPPGSTPLSQIVEEFADDQDAWLNDFVPALEKMLSNGYTSLDDGPDPMTDITCPRVGPWVDGYYNCFKSSNGAPNMDGPPFYIKMTWTTDGGFNGVLQESLASGSPQLWTQNGNLNQLWRWSVGGDQLINVGTGNPLTIAGQMTWEFKDQHVVSKINDHGIDCYNGGTPQDGSGVTTWTQHGAPWQIWVLEDGPTTDAPPTTTATKAPATTPKKPAKKPGKKPGKKTGKKPPKKTGKKPKRPKKTGKKPINIGGKNSGKKPTNIGGKNSGKKPTNNAGKKPPKKAKKAKKAKKVKKPKRPKGKKG
jgi:hypothetical protein